MSGLFEARGLRKYLLEWLENIINEKPEELVCYEDVLKLLLVETECPVVTLLDEFLHNKVISEKDFQIIPEYDDSLG